MNANKKNLEKVLTKALQFRDKGKSISDILLTFPKQKKELQELFKIIEAITRQKKNINPSQELLIKIIAQVSPIAQTVEKKKVSRYAPSRVETKDRPSILEQIVKGVQSMTTKWKILLPVGMTVIILLLITAFSGRKTPTDLNIAEITREQERISNLIAELDEETSEETALQEVERALDEASDIFPTPTLPAPTQAPTTKPATTKDPFELASIQTESKGIAFDSGLDSFFSEETSLEEIDSALADF